MSARATASPAQLKALLAEQPGPGIVYAPSRDKTEKLAEQLGATGRPALPYHAGLEPPVRAAQPGGVRRAPRRW